MKKTREDYNDNWYVSRKEGGRGLASIETCVDASIQGLERAKKVLGITHLFPHNELVHLPYIAVANNTRAD